MKKSYLIILVIILLLNFNICEANSETINLVYDKNGIDENNIKIKSLGYKLTGETYEIILTCEVPEDMGYSFFNPPSADAILISDLKGLKKGVNTIILHFAKKTYETLSEKLLIFDFKWSSGKKEAYITTSISDLVNADFNTDTEWPSNLPEKFDPVKIMELGKSPGLNLRQLHKKGITGKGISIAVIDQKLLREHDEFADRMKYYEEVKCPQKEPQMHSAAVVSLAAGKTVGTAPQADIYYIATTFGTNDGDKNFNMNFAPLADAINRILDINQKLSKPEKIRVISISVGWTKNSKGYENVTKAVERAKKEGIFIISTSLSEIYGFEIYGLGREPLSNPDDVNSYMPGKFWSSDFYKYPEHFSKPMLLVPMDMRTYAGHLHKNMYSFNYEGGLSWAIPYIAGVYILMCQVKSDLTPEIFWKAALDTGSEITLKKDGKYIKLGRILNPIKLKDTLANLK